jgi:hypothetical protein
VRVIDTPSNRAEHTSKNSYVDASKRATLLVDQLMTGFVAAKAILSLLIFQ